MLRIRQENIQVYKASQVPMASDIGCQSAVQSQLMKKEVINRYFHGDRARKKVFLSFLKKGYIGLLLYAGEEWVSYGWMSTLAANRPPHFPKHIVPDQGYWIFYCHTSNKYRGQGFYKRVLTELIHIASNHEHHTEMYIDTEVGNRISQKGILSSGFELIGTVQSWYFILFNTWLHLKSKWGENN